MVLKESSQTADIFIDFTKFVPPLYILNQFHQILDPDFNVESMKKLKLLEPSPDFLGS